MVGLYCLVWCGRLCEMVWVVWYCVVWDGKVYNMVCCGVFGGMPGGHMGVDKAPAEHIYTDNWCEDLGSPK